MRVFKELEDIEFNKKNSIYDTTSDLRKDFIILELGKVMISGNNRYHKTLIHESNTLPSVIPYRILNYYKLDNYDLEKGYYHHDEKDLIGCTTELGLDVIDGVECIIIRLDDKAISYIKTHLKPDEEFDFTVLGHATLYPGDILSGGVDTKFLSRIDCIFFNKRKKNEETGI